MHSAELQVEGDEARLSGDLTFSTVTGLYERMLNQAKKSGMPRLVELGDVRKIDSSGLALLLEWQSQFSRASGASARIAFRDPPEALVKIARLCGAEEYLSVTEAGEGETGPQ